MSGSSGMRSHKQTSRLKVYVVNYCENVSYMSVESVAVVVHSLHNQSLAIENQQAEGNTSINNGDLVINTDKAEMHISSSNIEINVNNYILENEGNISAVPAGLPLRPNKWRRGQGISRPSEGG